MEELKYTVYMHTNKINNKMYIGITSLLPKKRWGKNGARYQHNKYFWNAIQKYGWNNFYHDILFTELSQEMAWDIEKALITAFETQNPEKGYNFGSGGEHGPTGSRRSEESRKRLSESKMGDKNPMYGKHLSEEHRKKIGDSERGDKNPNYGKTFSKAHRKALSDAHIGKRTQGVYCVELDKYFTSITGAGYELNINYTLISNACHGRQQTAGGYHWQYVGNRGDYNESIIV